MTDLIDKFITRWAGTSGSERANHQLFLTELCTLLALPLPEPASKDTENNAYVFERYVVTKQPDGSQSYGFIDLYKRDCFVLEAKQSGKTLDSSSWDKAMLRAHNQADQYARALPSSEGRPPFIIVVDVGRNIELYAEFSRSGATYTAFPDATSHRLRLEDLQKPEIQERLRTVWSDPLSLDPSRHAAKVTREIADQLAQLAKSLEAAGHAPQDVAAFLMRCLFTMFAEDVGLIPNRSFTAVLEELQDTPEIFTDMLESLWQTMNTGGFSSIIKKKLLKFNGGLFADHRAIGLDKNQIKLLLSAARSDWQFVEPAIFGTLLERALVAKERHKLGAHYTPRAYVERLVLPTVIEPLRREWQEVQAAALAYEQTNKHKDAVKEVKKFHMHLCNIKILDPACGTGNFLYVTLEHMKRLEGEVLNLLADLGEQASMLAMDGVTVDPHQFLGLEINPRAARIAELVLWIGYLQWHYRTHGNVSLPEPVLRDFKNIENRDALISYKRREALLDAQGKPVTRWDGETYKTSPITGENIPDESAQVEQYRYLGVNKAIWPKADYIVGNPPFIGNKRMRLSLGDGYVEVLRKAWSEVPESADFVMYWWHIAAEAVRDNITQQFGFITTNSIKQTFNRRIIEAQLTAKNPLSLTFAIPDHPWVDSADGAAVRISMTVAANANTASEGVILLVTSEQETGEDAHAVTFTRKNGLVYADLSVGANLAASKVLMASKKISNRGVIPHGAGMLIPSSQLDLVEVDAPLRPYRNGKDLTDRPRNVYVIDCYGMGIDDVKTQYPKLYQWLLERVKPERDLQTDKTLREKWWLHRRNNDDLRFAIKGIQRYIATGQTAKHRIFQFLDGAILPDDKLIAIGLDDAFYLGVLSSRLHVFWALATGATLEDRPVYNKTACFDAFPFPITTPDQQVKIRTLAEQLDAHRKRQQAEHTDLTLTGMYNILEKIRLGDTLTDKDKTIHQKGLVSILRELHDDLDRAVFEAYGWSDLAVQLVGKAGATTPYPNKPEDQAAAEEELLKRLVDLNTQRANDEANGIIHWLRPDYQNPTAVAAQTQTQGELDTTSADDATSSASSKVAAKHTWPKEMREQVAIVRQTVKDRPSNAEQIASLFQRKPVASVQSVLDALESLGMVGCTDDVYRLL